VAKVDVIHNKMAIFMLCEAIGGDREEFKDLKADENGLYDVTITLNGIKVDVNRFIENLDRSYRDAVKRQARDLLSMQYDKISSIINEIQESLESHNKLFDDKILERLFD
jgi:hypothetical protein